MDNERNSMASHTGRTHFGYSPFVHGNNEQMRSTTPAIIVRLLIRTRLSYAKVWPKWLDLFDHKIRCSFAGLSAALAFCVTEVGKKSGNVVHNKCHWRTLQRTLCNLWFHFEI